MYEASESSLPIPGFYWYQTHSTPDYYYLVWFEAPISSVGVSTGPLTAVSAGPR